LVNYKLLSPEKSLLVTVWTNIANVIDTELK